MNEKRELQQESEQEAFSKLRSEFYDGGKILVKERSEKHPQPSEHELRIGAYEEEIEPQMRQALQALYNKGYATESSGFGGIDHPEIQQVDGYFEIDAATEEKLKAFGAWVTREKSDYDNSVLTRIEFKTQEPDTDKISAKWMEIVGALPPIGEETYSLSAPSIEFRDKFLGEDESRRIHIETRLKRGIMPKEDLEGAKAWLADYENRKKEK